MLGLRLPPPSRGSGKSWGEAVETAPSWSPLQGLVSAFLCLRTIKEAENCFLPRTIVAPKQDHRCSSGIVSANYCCETNNHNTWLLKQPFFAPVLPLKLGSAVVLLLVITMVTQEALVI